MQLRRISLFSVLALTALAGCDRLTATTFAVSVLTRTPNLSDAATAAGVSADLVSSIGANAIPQATAVAVGVGERASVTSTSGVTAVTGATVAVSFQNSAGANVEVPLCEPTGASSAAGSYQASSVAGAACASTTLQYIAGQHYTTTITKGVDVYTLDIVAPPALARTAISFSPDFGNNKQNLGTFAQVPVHAINTPLTVSWGSAAASNNVIVFIYRVKFNGDWTLASSLMNQSNWVPDTQPSVLIGDPGDPFTSMPQEPAILLDFVTRNPPTSLTVPASVFAQGGAYAVMVTRVDISSQTSSNLSLGSTALAGEGTGFVLVVK